VAGAAGDIFADSEVTTMPAIEANALTKVFRTKVKESGLRGSVSALFRPQYRDVCAVRGIDLTVQKGEVLAFIGPNGAGKSTTIKMLTGILHPTSGGATVLGLDPLRQRKQLAYRIGSVFGQKSQLWFHLPPQDSFRLLSGIYELDEREYRERFSALVELFELADLLKVPVRKLSLGQRVRCEIAASLLHRPEVIFLDEPTIGLDVVAKQRIRDLIARLNREEGTTIFLTSHDIGDIERVCKRVVIINHGEVVLDESVKTLKYSYLQKKIISVKYAEKTKVDIPGVDKMRESDYAARIEVSTSVRPLREVIAELMGLGEVVDITISDQPLEEIIAGIYMDRGRGGGTDESATGTDR
jgi:ABC-2 type transport system ATP-binding protein